MPSSSRRMAFARRAMRCSSSPSLVIATRSARSAVLRKLRLGFTRRMESIPLIRSNDFRKNEESRYIQKNMTHTVRNKQKLLGRVRRIRGQIEAVERALDEEAGCEKVMHLIAAVRGATAGLMAEVVEDHVRAHLVDEERYPGALNLDAADQLLDVVRTYLK